MRPEHRLALDPSNPCAGLVRGWQNLQVMALVKNRESAEHGIIAKKRLQTHVAAKDYVTGETVEWTSDDSRDRT